MATTTIQLSTETKKKLEALKGHEREPFEEVISKLLALIPERDEEGKYSDEFRAGLLEALADSRKGNVYTLEQLKRELKLM